jgi:hypothetical protein
LAAHRVQQSHVGDGDAGHLLEPLAQHHRHGIHAATAFLAVHQTDIQAGVHLANGVAGVDGGQRVAHLGEAADDGLHLRALASVTSSEEPTGV